MPEATPTAVPYAMVAVSPRFLTKLQLSNVKHGQRLIFFKLVFVRVRALFNVRCVLESMLRTSLNYEI